MVNDGWEWFIGGLTMPLNDVEWWSWWVILNSGQLWSIKSLIHSWKGKITLRIIHQAWTIHLIICMMIGCDGSCPKGLIQDLWLSNDLGMTQGWSQPWPYKTSNSLRIGGSRDVPGMVRSWRWSIPGSGGFSSIDREALASLTQFQTGPMWRWISSCKQRYVM